MQTRTASPSRILKCAIGAAAVGGLLLAPSAGASQPALPDRPSGLSSPPPSAVAAKAGHKGVKAHRLTRAERRQLRAHAAPRAGLASLPDAWVGGGVSATCVGTSVEVSVGQYAGFGLAPGSTYQWRSWIYNYKPATGQNSWTTTNDFLTQRVTPQSSYTSVPGSTDITFTFGPSGGINPAQAVHQAWTIPVGWYSIPYLEVRGIGFHPINYDYTGAGQYFAPNWCLSKVSSWL